MKWVKGVLLLAVCAVFAAGATQVYAAEQTEDTMEDGIRIGGIDVGGMNYQKAEKAVKEVVDQKLSTKVRLQIGDNVAKVSLKKLGYRWSDNYVIEEAIGAGKKGNIIKRFKDRLALQNHGQVYDIDISVKDQNLSDNLKKQCEAYDLDAQNASLKFTGNGFEIIPEQNGYEVDYKTTSEKIRECVDGDWQEGAELSVSAVVKTTTPKYTEKDLEKISDVAMGSFSTTFTVGGPYENRNMNIKNGVEKMDGKILYPGETLSCNEVYAPWTEENGWYPAGTYAEGEVVDSLGGGICQVSSTLYNALLRAEITVIERYSHSMSVSYVERAADAALAGDYKDLKFRNDTDAPIYIRGIYESGQLTFKIYGHDTRPENRSVEYVSVTTKTIPVKDKVTKDSSKPKGYKSVESDGHVGYVAELYKVVYEDGEEVSREKLHTSTYAMSPRKVIKGTGTEEKTTEEKTTKEKDPKEKPTEKEIKEASEPQTTKQTKKTAKKGTTAQDE